MPNKYRDSKGRTVTIVNVENNIAQLNNGDRVAVERLNNPKYFNPILENSSQVMSNTTTTTNINTDQVMGNKGNRYEDMFNSLQEGSTNKVSIGEESNDQTRNSQYTGSQYAPSSEVKMSGSIVESHRDNLKEMGADERDIPKLNQVVESHIPNNRPTTEADLINKYANTAPPIPNKLNEIVDAKPGSVDDYMSNSAPPPARATPAIQTEAPITDPHNVRQEPAVHTMFDKAKKVHSINVSLKISEKIPDKNVIKMLEENFDESAIDYYTTEVFKKLMSNPRIIEDQVRQTIEKYVNGRAKPKTKKSTPGAKTTKTPPPVKKP